jgi:hypothetical protein
MIWIKVALNLHFWSRHGGAGPQQPKRIGAMYQPGDRVIYVAEKHSPHPGPRAEAVQPETNGEGYSYRVKKFWVVLQVQDDSLVVRTRRGKQRSVSTSDPRLRPARWWEKLLLSSRFPDQLQDREEPSESQRAAG